MNLGWEGTQKKWSFGLSPCMPLGMLGIFTYTFAVACVKIPSIPKACQHTHSIAFQPLLYMTQMSYVGLLYRYAGYRHACDGALGIGRQVFGMGTFLHGSRSSDCVGGISTCIRCL